MKHYYIFTLLAVLTFYSCSGEGEQTTESENEKYVHVPPSLPDHVYDELQEGDVIIRKGNGPLSYHLMNNTKEDYSHCGVLVKEEGEWTIIHTIGGTSSEDAIDGMQTQSLKEFVMNAADSMLYICRPIFVDSAGPKIKERAYYYLDQEIPFDHRFSVFTTDEFYCTELLFYIFRDVGGKKIFDIQKKHKSYMLMFSTFFNEENFEPIFHLKEDL
ncbi:MAG: hypothetical protein MI810_14120 [Flavobacteriales bacterium]|nr:hypothetical protein [Flavobacteriales bacterium]